VSAEEAEFRLLEGDAVALLFCGGVDAAAARDAIERSWGAEPAREIEAARARRKNRSAS
jgi:hypothetical protein